MGRGGALGGRAGWKWRSGGGVRVGGLRVREGSQGRPGARAACSLPAVSSANLATAAARTPANRDCGAKTKYMCCGAHRAARRRGVRHGAGTGLDSARHRHDRRARARHYAAKPRFPFAARRPLRDIPPLSTFLAHNGKNKEKKKKEKRNTRELKKKRKRGWQLTRSGCEPWVGGRCSAPGRPHYSKYRCLSLYRSLSLLLARAHFSLVVEGVWRSSSSSPDSSS